MDAPGACPPRGRHPEQASRWTWLILAVYVQLVFVKGIVADRRLPGASVSVKTVATFDVAAESDPNLRKGATRMETLADVKLVEPEPDHRVVGWRWAEGYGAGKEGY